MSAARAPPRIVVRSIPDERFILAGSSHVTGFQNYDELTLQASAAEPHPTEIVDSDPYNIIYSRGTTGSPKRIVHKHYIRVMYCTLFASTLPHGPRERGAALGLHRFQRRRPHAYARDVSRCEVHLGQEL